MKYFFFLLISFVCFCKISAAQTLSTDEFLSLKNMSLDSINSLMTNKKFVRYDTSAGNMLFIFFSNSKLTTNGSVIRYLQLAIKKDDSYAEIQYQTSLKTESLQMQNGLISNGFIKAIAADTSASFTFSKADEVIIFSNESLSDSATFFYTFSIRLNKPLISKSIIKDI